MLKAWGSMLAWLSQTHPRPFSAQVVPTLIFALSLLSHYRIWRFLQLRLRFGSFLLSGFPTWILVLSPHLHSLFKSHGILHFLSFCDLTLPQPDKTNLLLPSSAHRKKTKKTCLLPHGKNRAPTFSASAEGNLCRRCGIVAPWRHCPGAAPHIF